MTRGFLFSAMEIKELYHYYTTTSGICTDSRKVSNNCMYVALKGEHFNGNEFAIESLKKGAKFAVVDDDSIPDHDGILRVKDGLVALQNLSTHHRHQFDIPVVGITGSNGKTTTKELMHSVLKEKFNVLATQGNFNNHIGVPLTLLGLNSGHEIAIIEMGASKQGDIKELCDVADPDYGLITNIGKAHIETMGGIQGVLKTKTELFDHIRKRNGNLLIHSCDKLLMENAGKDAGFFYGTLPTDDVQGRVVRDGNLISVQWHRKESEGLIDEAPVVKTKLTGAYNLPNIMAAIATGIVFGLSDEEIARGLTSYQPTNNRSEIRKKGSNTFILDAYNANPSSMEVAITNLMGTDGIHRSVILGEMLELGDTSASEHRQICNRLTKLQLKHVCLVGTEFKQLRDEYDFNFFENVEELNEWLRNHRFEDEIVLIKGSRGNKLEKAAELLLA